MRFTFDGGGEHGFRSDLERKVSEELTRLEVRWRYEVPVQLPGGIQVMYLPDFVIDEAKPDLALPAWVECKPMQMLYNLRDTLGVTRKVGEYFKDDVTVDGLSSADLHDRDLAELAKPKRLAELTGLDILLVGSVQATTSLSVLLTASGCVLSRRHPFVNQRGVARQRERDEKRAQWAVDRDRLIAEWESERQKRVTQETELRAAHVRQSVRNITGIGPRYSSSCYLCRRNGTDGLIYRVPFTNGTEGWQRVCATCRAAVL